MIQSEIDRLVCPKCGEHNRPNVKPLIEVIERGVGLCHCHVCDCVGQQSAFMPWLGKAMR